MRLIALLFATSSVFAQTAATKPATTAAKTGVHKTGVAAAASQGANAPGIPKVVGIPKTLYSLRYIDTVIGTGDLAVPRKWYTVHYTGYLTDGTKFDSSVDRGQPFTFPYGARRVIAGWDTGFEGMRIGGKRRLIVPYQLAYGEQANEKISAKSTLIFDVELLGMSDTPPAPPVKITEPPAQQKQQIPPATDGSSGAVPATPPPSSGGSVGTAPLGTAKPATSTTPTDPSKPTPPATTNQAPDPAKLPGAPPNGF